MCGLAGKLWLDPARPADTATVAAMTARLVHRGPDDEGYHHAGPLALGHRRLTIVDLSERGRQPMHSPDGRAVLVANGEIYNHAELRAALGAKGHRFRSDCDVEVLLALYAEHWEREGPRFVDRIEGMLAFALWDTVARRLVLGRDRTGQKPLVYALREEGPDAAITFASELQALSAEPSLDRTPDGRALSDYLAFRVVPHPRTAWVGARKLPPAHVLVVEDGRASMHCTWRVAPGSDVSAAPSLDEAAEELEHRLSEAVRRRLMADVPLGALLSGGIDSAAVVAFMAEHASGPVKTFSIGFDETAWDETPRARKVAAHFGTEHHEQIVRPDALALLDQVLDHFGEPFADSSALPTFLVSQLASRHVKVVLTGDGADESFAGYDRHRALVLAAQLSKAWALPLRAGVRLAAAVIPAGGGHRSLGTRLGRFAEALSASPRRRNHLWRLGMPASLRDDLLTDDGRTLLGDPEPYGPDVDLDLPLNEALVLDLERYLPDDILVKVDIASMACSLEARAPFLDRDVLEFAASLPARHKFRTAGPLGWLGAGTSKAVLRRALRRRLPPDLLDGPKRGFGVPLDAWFRGPLREHARDVLLAPEATARGLFRPDRVNTLLDHHASGRVAAHETIFTLLCLERWFQREDEETH